VRLAIIEHHVAWEGSIEDYANGIKKATHIEIKRSTKDRKEPQNLIKATYTAMVP